VPIGAAAVVEGERLSLRGVVLTPDGLQRMAGEKIGPAAAAEAVGQQLADDLLQQGARALLLQS